VDGEKLDDLEIAPIGELVEMRPFAASASSGMTIWKITVSPLSSRRCTVEPNAARSCGILSRFMIEISAIRFLSIAMRPVTIDCRSLAA
jgi:hypothetical protein